MNEFNPFLRAAAQEIQVGRFDAAKNILIGVLNQNPNSPDAWYLLGTAVDNPREAAFCLRRALTIQPGHVGALQGIEKLTKDFSQAPLQVMEVGPNSAALGQSCPYCLGSFAISEQVVACSTCQKLHHFNCWVENGYACARRFCNGFSLNEVIASTLPIQPPKNPDQVTVIKKEDISQIDITSRKQKEESFARRLLVMALLAEEGIIPEDEVRGLPSIDDLMVQLQHPAANPSAGGSANLTIPSGPDRFPHPEQPSKFCLYCGKNYPRPESKFCGYCGKSRK